MGDRAYAEITLAGHIETVPGAEQIVEAIHVDTGIDADDIVALMRQTAERNMHPSWGVDEVNYGTFRLIEEAVKELGLACATRHEAGGDFGAGTQTVMPDGSTHACSRDAGCITISLDALAKARAEPDPLAAIDALIAEHRLAGGLSLPPFTVSPAVAAWLKIFGTAPVPVAA